MFQTPCLKMSLLQIIFFQKYKAYARITHLKINIHKNKEGKPHLKQKKEL